MTYKRFVEYNQDGSTQILPEFQLHTNFFLGVDIVMENTSLKNISLKKIVSKKLFTSRFFLLMRSCKKRLFGFFYMYLT
ncbi:hypothetical protein RCL_jg28698.t1 [Rhizophagus clarus]|uniref:Uncharacterized protein n=1 Tax=Rhizophagus clarus TaxID=94130 RepID=A0A8H3QWX9_9GLOM|nr:hypothetical protein RCL_jg28698.t1 [Rhizophagus clarus]